MALDTSPVFKNCLMNLWLQLNKFVMLDAESRQMPQTFHDVTMDSESLKPVPEVNNRASFKSFVIRLGIFITVLIAAFALVVYFKSTPALKPTSLTSMDDKDKGIKEQPDNQKKTSTPQDEDEKKSRRNIDNEPKTDSGGDGKEPPSHSQWETIHRGNVNSNIGIPIVKDNEQSETKSVADSKQISSEQETEDMDERENYEMIRGPDVKGADPRAAQIGSSRP